MSDVRRSAGWLADTLADQETRLRLVESRKPGLANSSIEDGAIEEYTADGTFASSVGKQPDGSHVAFPATGPTPAAPVGATLKAFPGGVEVRWNGKFAGDAVSSLDFKHVAIHAGPAPEVDTTPSSQAATIRGELGDVATITAPEGTLYVRLVAWTEAGKFSDPSPVASIEVPADVQDAIVQLGNDLQVVQESVDGKTAITNATVQPAVDGTTTGDRWQKWDTLAEGGKLIGSWRWTGSEWLLEAMDPTYLPLIDIGSGTFGLLAGGRLVAQSVKAEALEALLILASDIVAGNPDAGHARMTPAGFKVFAPGADGNPTEVARMGTGDGSDVIGIVGPDGLVKAGFNSEGKVTGQDIDVANDVILDGDSLLERLNRLPRGVAAWRQFPRGNEYGWPNLTGSGEVGLFEIGWKTSEDNPARLYSVSVPPILLKSAAAGAITTGLIMRYTDDGTPPTVNSPRITMDYGYTSAGGFNSAGFSDVLIGSANGPYIRVLITMWGTGAVGLDSVALPQIVVKDLGLAIPATGSMTTGGGGSVPPPTDPVVTKTVTYSHTSVRSFLGNNAFYDYSPGKGYQGLQPYTANGNLKSLWTFPSLTGILAGATVNKIEAYFYFEHWNNGSGGTARIVAHGNSGQPATYSSLILAVSSPNWPRGAGRWVTIPSSLYAGFKSGTYKGFGLEGDGTLNTYGIANAAKIRVTYTK